MADDPVKNGVGAWASPHAVPRPPNRSEFATPHAANYGETNGLPYQEAGFETPAERRERERIAAEYMARCEEEADRNLIAHFAQYDRPWQGTSNARQSLVITGREARERTAAVLEYLEELAPEPEPPKPRRKRSRK